MLKFKRNLVIGLIITHPEMMRISVPAIGRLNEKFVLVVHNANPSVRVKARQIRALGYHGDLQIINTDTQISDIDAYIAVANTAANVRGAQWLIYVSENTMLLNADIPNVAPDNFAVMKNIATAGRRIVDIFRIMDAPENIYPDGKNICIINPNASVNATPVRINQISELVKCAQLLTEQISELDDTAGEYAPADIVLWRWLNAYTRHNEPNATPIYMNQIAAIKFIDAVDTASRTYAQRHDRAIAKYDTLLMTILAARE